MSDAENPPQPSLTSAELAEPSSPGRVTPTFSSTSDAESPPPELPLTPEELAKPSSPGRLTPTSDAEDPGPENPAPDSPEPALTPAELSEPPSPGRAVTPTISDIVQLLTIRALKEYADIDTGPVGQEGAKPWYEKTPIDKRRTTVLDAKKLCAAQLRDGEESEVSEDDDDEESVESEFESEESSPEGPVEAEEESEESEKSEGSVEKSDKSEESPESSGESSPGSPDGAASRRVVRQKTRRVARHAARLASRRELRQESRRELRHAERRAARHVERHRARRAERHAQRRVARRELRHTQKRATRRAEREAAAVSPGESPTGSVEGEEREGRSGRDKRRRDKKRERQEKKSRAAMEGADRATAEDEGELGPVGAQEGEEDERELLAIGAAGASMSEEAEGRSLLTPRRRRVKVPPKRKIRELPESLAFEAVGHHAVRDATPSAARPARRMKKTQIDSESSSSESEEESVGSAGSSSDEGDEMVVLDPDHPLMLRFQNALHRHLKKQIVKVNLEVSELDFMLKGKQGEREDMGVDLYSVQQELARNQMSVEQLHDDYAKRQKHRLQAEQELTEMRETYTGKQKLIKMERKKAADLLAEVENLALRLYYMESAKDDVRSDIAVMKRAAEKAEMEVARSEMDKQKQDIYVNRLVERVDKLQETIAMYDAQITAQREETKAAEDALSEARMEIEAITLEKKQLFHQWNCSLIGMRRRDEARAAMQEALDQEHQRIISLETEIDGYKRSTQKEQEQNEKLMMILNKAENDIATIRKQMAQCQTKLDALKNEYATYTRMLLETEQSLNRANADKATWTVQQKAVRKQLEQQYDEKMKLEDGILQKMHDQLTIDKAAKYTFKLVKNLRQKTKATATNIARIENDISNDTLEGSNLLARIERLTETITDFEVDIRMKNEIVSRCEAETIKRNATIERKQGVIDQLNKKIDQLLTQSGGVELGPLEVTINSLQKSIMAEGEETTELQNMWLRNQHELVQLTKETNSQQCDINNIKKQLTILQQRKLRTEGEIEMEKAEAMEQERDIGTIEKDMMKLNMLLYKKRGLHHELEQSNSLMESDFIGSLREAERDSIQLQEQLNGLQEEKERLLNSLVEAERQIMLWEKKTQLARETRAAVDSDIGEGEIKAMKAEIHRMQVRHGQLLKTQERMIQDMEKAVSRRDTIVTRGEARAKLDKKVITKSKFQRQLADLRKKIKNAIAEANSCDGDIETLRTDQSDLSRHLEEKQLNVQQLQSSVDMLDGDIEQRTEEKQKNLLNLVLRQQKNKSLQQMKDGKYVRICRTESARDTERVRQLDRMQSILAIVDRLTNDLPNLQPALQRVSNVYGSEQAAVGSQDSITSSSI